MTSKQQQVANFKSTLDYVEEDTKRLAEQAKKIGDPELIKRADGLSKSASETKQYVTSRSESKD